MERPRPITGSSSQANWLNRLLRLATENVILPGRGYKIARTTAGTVLEIERGGGGSSTGSAVSMFKIKSLEADYLVCRTWDGTDEGDEDVNVARPIKLRNPASEVIDGSTINYVYVSTVDRRAEIDGQTDNSFEAQKIIPRYEIDSVIFAITADTGDEDVEYLDLNTDARAWASEYYV
jgi:hypothetical protein